MKNQVNEFRIQQIGAGVTGHGSRRCQTNRKEM